jgi:hypothetical protein
LVERHRQGGHRLRCFTSSALNQGFHTGSLMGGQ